MTADRTFVPMLVRAPRGGDTLEVEWGDGHVGRYPNELLRGYCPCAGCQGHTGSIAFVSGHNAVVDGIEEAGNYGLSITWGDGHNGGIYTYRYLRALCACATCLPGSPMERRAPLARI